jgi:hypothetical protein
MHVRRITALLKRTFHSAGCDTIQLTQHLIAQVASLQVLLKYRGSARHGLGGLVPE